MPRGPRRRTCGRPCRRATWNDNLFAATCRFFRSRRFEVPPERESLLTTPRRRGETFGVDRDGVRPRVEHPRSRVERGMEASDRRSARGGVERVARQPRGGRGKMRKKMHPGGLPTLGTIASRASHGPSSRVGTSASPSRRRAITSASSTTSTTRIFRGASDGARAPRCARREAGTSGVNPTTSNGSPRRPTNCPCAWSTLRVPKETQQSSTKYPTADGSTADGSASVTR